MQSSKFKGILLFFMAFCVLGIMPISAKAASYTFGFDAYVCGSTSSTDLEACKSSYYAGSLAKLSAGATMDKGTKIMLVVKYDHDFTSLTASDDNYFGKGAYTLKVVPTFDNTAVSVLQFQQGRTTANAIFTAVDSANPVFSGEFAYATAKWTAQSTATASAVNIVYSSTDVNETLTYNPGAIGFIFFEVKSTATAGATFTFDFLTTAGVGTNLSDVNSQAISWTSSPISFKVAGAATSTDRTLKSFTSTGDNSESYTLYEDSNYTTGFTAGTSTREFYVVVPNGVEKITLNAEVTDSTAQFIPGNETTYSVEHDLNIGNNEKTFIVHAQSGDEDTYKVNIYRLSADATLQTLTSSNTNVVIPSFASTTYTYPISANYNINNNTHTNTNTTITSRPTHANAFVTDTDNTVWTKSSSNYTSEFLMPHYGSTVNTKVIKVQAEDCLEKYSSVPGNTCHTQNYTLNVTRANPATDATLKALAVDGTSIFATGQTSYDQGIQRYSKSNVDITATANDTKATVVSTTVGNKSLNVGYTTLTVTVQAEDCKTITGSDASPNCTTKDYTIQFYRNSNNANLNTLVVSGTDVSMSPAFTDHGYGGPYTVSYPSGATSVGVSATTEEPHASINITGITSGITYEDLDNQLSIIVTAEDGNAKTYVLRFSKVLSTESRLSGLTVSGVTLSPSPFDSDTYSYTGSVDGNVEKVTINATLVDDEKSDFMEGYGPRTVDLHYGPNVFYVRVQGEADDATSSYNITITRNEKSIKSLKEITVDGVAVSPFDAETMNYTVSAVPYTTTQVTVAATVTDNSDATYTVLNQSGGVAAGGVIDLATGNNTVTIRVRAQDGSTGDYTVTIPRTKNNDASIRSVSFFGENATCNPTTRQCTITLANEHSTLAPTDVVVTPTDSAANVTTPTDTRPLVVTTPSNPRTNAYIFSVTAEDTTTTLEYEVTITREANSDNSLTEVSVKTNTGEIFRCTSFTDYACTISVPSTTTSYILDAVTSAPASITHVSGTGTYTMSGSTDSSQLRTLTVEAENEISQTYQIRIERGKSTNANLSTITIDGTQIDGFDGVNTQIYNVTVPGTTEAITLGAVVDDVGKAEIENESTVLGRKDLSYGDNTYTIKVIAEAGGSAVKTYTITVHRNNNIDSSLSMITIGGSNLDGFNTATTLYEYNSTYYQSLGTSNPLSVPYTQTSVTLVGTPTDTIHGTVKYNGGTENTIELHTGLNEITVTGIAHDTSRTTDYVLKIYRALNTSNSIAKLEVAGVEATWDSTNEKYTVTVPNSVTSVGPLNVDVTLPATQLATDPKATVTIPTKTLVTDDPTNGNVNNYQITVTSESGDTKTYNVEITRTKSAVNTLKALTITNGAFSPSFVSSANLVEGEDINHYTVIVPASTTQFTVSYVKDDTKSNVSINPSAVVTMDESQKTVIVTVTAENGDENTYTLNVERTESAVTTLSSLTVNAGSTVYPLEETFSPDQTSYTVKVPGTVDEINITATPSDNRASVTSGNGTHSVSLGEQTFTIRVGAEVAGTFTDYTVKVIVLPKTIATLDGLSVVIPKTDGTSTPLPLSPDFDEDVLNYTLSDQPYNVSKINITALVTDSDATLKINGETVTSGTASQQTIEVGNNSIPVTVTAQDGKTIGNYKINVKRAGNNDATLANLNVSGGTLDKGFDPAITEYTVTVSPTTTTIDPNNVSASPNDSNARVVKDGELTITGDAEHDAFNINVTAQDGITTKTYVVHVVRRLSSDATLKSVTLTGASLEGSFLSSNHTYVINVPTTSTSFEITGVPNSTLAKRVEGNGTYNVSETTSVTLKVVAEDDTEGEYTFTVYTASSQDATLANLEVAGYTLDPSFVTTTLRYDIGEVYLGINSLNVIATPTNPNAKVYYYIGSQTPAQSGIVSLPQAIGDYTVTVKVVPATGIETNAKYYLINYHMVTSGNNNLSQLLPSTGTLNPAFSKTVSSYRISVPYDNTSISFQVRAEDTSASVSTNRDSGYVFTDTEAKTFTFDNLSVGPNSKTIYVKAANGDIKEYSINITRNNRVASDDKYLSALSVDDYTYLETPATPTLTPTFNREVEEYSIGAIPFGLETLTVRASKNFSAQTITYNLNGSATRVVDNGDGTATINVKDKEGQNHIDVIVTAENGDVKTYQINYTRTPSTNVYLESIVDSLGKITGFNKTKTSYEITVDSTVTTLRMSLTTEDRTSTITIGGETRTHQWAYVTPQLAGGANTVTILVTAENKATRTYTVTINKEGSSELITSKVFGHKIEDGMIKSAILNESLLDLKDQLDNDNTKLQIWDAGETTEITDLTTKVATGQIVKLVDLTTGKELDRKVVVVLGDTDGNGKITLFDSVKIVNHYLDKAQLEGAYLVAADVDKNTKITLFDSVKIVNHYLDKAYIDYSV